MATFRQILVPVDFSSFSDQAVRVAADVARQYGASMTLAHVLDPLAHAVVEYEAQTSDRRLALMAEIEKGLAAGKARALEAGATNVKTQSLEGGVPATIIAYSRSAGFDLIVMGTHGRTGITRAVLGSVSETVLRGADCPVLIAKRPKAA